jgi:hypothetical protein
MKIITTAHSRRHPKRSILIFLLIVVLGSVADPRLNARADHWPPELWERLNCEHS